MKKSTVIFVQAALVSMLGAALSAVIFSQWFRSCCASVVTGWRGYFFLPGMVIGTFIGGGIQRATPVHYGIGIVIEILLIWSGGYWLFSRLRRRHIAFIRAEGEHSHK